MGRGRAAARRCADQAEPSTRVGRFLTLDDVHAAVAVGVVDGARHRQNVLQCVERPRALHRTDSPAALDAGERPDRFALGRVPPQHHADTLAGLTYDQATQKLFYRASGFVAWECIFQEGIDMEALSPRDANAGIRVKQPATKPKAPQAKLTQKEKDHPPPPPENVQEPPSSDRPNGATYKTGRLLGKGGFAICYEGEQVQTNQKYALKIVKSHMPQKKMEQKVSRVNIGVNVQELIP